MKITYLHDGVEIGYLNRIPIKSPKSTYVYHAFLKDGKRVGTFFKLGLAKKIMYQEFTSV